MSPIDSWDGATAVFTGADSTFVSVVFVLLAVALFIGFLGLMFRHESHAYRQMIEHTPIEPGPAVEGEPTVY